MAFSKIDYDEQLLWRNGNNDVDLHVPGNCLIGGIDCLDSEPE